MELICIGFLLGVILTMIVFIGGVLYGGAITGDNRESLPAGNDRFYSGSLPYGVNFKDHRLDISSSDTEKKEPGAEA